MDVSRKFKSRFQRIKVLERYIYLDYLILYIFSFLFLLVTFSDIHIVPDYFGLAEIKAPLDLLGLIIGSTSSILGIVVSVILIRFELLRQVLGRKSYQHFLNNKWFKILKTLLLVSIVWPFIVFATITHLKQDVLTTHLYLSCFLFITSLTMLFPACYKILFSTSSLKIIPEELKKLNNEFIKNQYKVSNPVVRKRYPLYEIDEHTPIDTLKRLGQNYVKENDHNAAKLLLIFSTKHLIDWIGVSKDRQTINDNPNIPVGAQMYGISDDRNIIGKKINVLTSIWQVIALEAIANKNTEVLICIWNVFYLLHEHFAKNKMYVLYLEELDYFEDDFIQLLKENSLSSVLSEGVTNMAKILKLHLTLNCPKEDPLKELFHFFNEPVDWGDEPSKDVNERLQWQHVFNPHKIEDLMSYAIKSNDQYLLFDCVFQMQHFIREVPRIEGLGERQKGFIIIQCYSICINHILELIQSGKYSQYSYLPHLFEGTDIGESVKNNTLYYKKLISRVSDFVINVESLHIKDYSHLQNFGALGRVCAEKVSEDKRYSEVCYFVLDTFKLLKEQFEQDLVKTSEQYLSLKEQIDSVKKWHTRDPTQNKELIAYCDSLLKSFDVSVQKKETWEYISWR